MRVILKFFIGLCVLDSVRSNEVLGNFFNVGTKIKQKGCAWRAEDTRQVVTPDVVFYSVTELGNTCICGHDTVVPFRNRP